MALAFFLTLVAASCVNTDTLLQKMGELARVEISKLTDATRDEMAPVLQLARLSS